MGRAARHVEGRAILYADVMTDSMRKALDETSRRRAHAGGVQRAQRHHAAIHHQADRHEPGGGGRGRLRHRAARSRRGSRADEHRAAGEVHRRSWKSACARPPGNSSSRKRRSCATGSKNSGRGTSRVSGFRRARFFGTSRFPRCRRLRLPRIEPHFRESRRPMPARACAQMPRLREEGRVPAVARTQPSNQ